MCKDLKEVGEQALIIPQALRQEHAGMFQKQQGDHRGGQSRIRGGNGRKQDNEQLVFVGACGLL